KMPAFEWVHVQLHQQKGMISLSPPTICNSAQISKKRGSSTGIPAGQVRFRFSLSGTWLTICNIIIKYNYASYFYSQNANNVAYTPV
ncbi:hypothetical protein, partial [Klebsiella pneumoniae]